MSRILLLLTSLLIAFGAQADGSVTVRVVGADPGVGQVAGSLFASEEAFLKQGVANARAEVDEQGEALLDFGVHPPGEYAVSVYWDEDGDGELDSGFMRIPKEKVGFSNNARGRFGPAKWKDASFTVGASGADIEIRVTKARD